MIMDKKSLLKKLHHSQRLQEKTGFFRQKGGVLLHGGSISQQALLLSLAFVEGLSHAVVIVPDANSLRQWRDDFYFFAPEIATGMFPFAEETDFAVAAKSMENEVERIRSLALLNGDEQAVVFATVTEAAAPIPAPERMNEARQLVCVGDILAREPLFRSWVEAGYERVEQVERRGHFAVRGDIIDVFSPQEEYPLRIECFGDEVENMRYFDALTQRSEQQVSKAEIYPLTPRGTESVLTAYIGNGVFLCEEPSRCADILQQVKKENPARAKKLRTWNDILAPCENLPQVYFSLISQRVPQARIRERQPFDGRGVTAFRKQWPLFVQEVKKWLKRGRAVVIAIGDEDKRNTLAKILRDANIFPTDTVASGMVTLADGAVSYGFEWPYENLVLLTEEDVFGSQKIRRRKKVKSGNEIRYFSDLAEGDYVVHQVHGIGRYTGVETISMGGLNRDYLRIEYAGEDKLFLPTERIGQLEKYIAPDGTVPTLHKMGGAQWTKVKAKAQQSIDDLAEKLVALYAEREIAKGFAFPPDTPWQREFEDAFPYEETADQLRATAEIKASMERPQPMDRLLCGDVGFGKTEVAMRAAFKAIMSGKQVAVLVPTTVLSQQHYRTFTDRMSSFGVNVGVINRFRSAGEKRDVMRRVRDGNLDVLIGTHALFNKAVRFADLGLLIVDEEQRFGVAQKEKWKKRAVDIDILTLSATPIPRTLHMSLAGVRELSVIYTPPADRQPVQTYVTEAADEIIREAILREHERGGQVYFVYNRIASIERMTEHLQSLLPPQVNFDIAHGAMTGEELERVMQEFYAQHFDVLVCTSLVENGLDQPNANTIIVYDADRLGLAQLYQMRGRVGRSARNAYAYFLYRPDKILNEAAEKRLYAIREFTELGAGFKIALRDLEIRGAGNLLGPEQHGNMVGVGFTTYCSMLDEAVAERRGIKPKRSVAEAPVLELQVEAYLPDTYIGDPVQKLEMYRRLAEIDTMTDWEELAAEIRDRFGTPPESAMRLLDVAKLRILAARAGIGMIRELEHSVEINWNRPEAMADWDIGAVSDKVMRTIQFLPLTPPRATINKIRWKMPAIDFLPQLLTEFLKKRNEE